MQQFSPFPSFQWYDNVDMIEEEQIINDVFVPQSFQKTSPILISGQIPVITTEQLTAISGISPIDTGALSLTEALQATMSAPATGRMIVIPGSRKQKKTQRDTIDSKLRMSPRLRHCIIIAVILLVIIVTLASLSPLSNGQIKLPVFSSIGNWVQAQQLSWQIQAHETAVSQQGSGLNNPVLPPMTLPKTQYVAIAQQDAITVGIPPDYFVRQIEQESGFNPNSVSPAGAVGIAQFLPSTAAGLGINPWDPIQALRGAARLMANYAHQYGGDYAKALAAYNGGSGTIQYAVNNCGANWLNCLPGETRHYIYIIMGI
ncbi:MAG TPA: lytic transglycosylase domain-containing protein [Ktedonobacteraceae bacterium]